MNFIDLKTPKCEPSPIYLVDTSNKVLFKRDEDLEKNLETKAENSLAEFLEIGGEIQCISDFTHPVPEIDLHLDHAYYPICSGGYCRSQTLWMILNALNDKLTLFPPHAARYGWDPYNGQINRKHKIIVEHIVDEFVDYFGKERAHRFGHENFNDWESVDEIPEELAKITTYYDKNYFGPQSSWQGRQGRKRIYISFSNNTHVTIHRLNQANDDLKNVKVISIELDDLITHPPDYLETFPRSKKSYAYFESLLRPLITSSNRNYNNHLSK